MTATKKPAKKATKLGAKKTIKKVASANSVHAKKSTKKAKAEDVAEADA